MDLSQNSVNQRSFKSSSIYYTTDAGSNLLLSFQANQQPNSGKLGILQLTNTTITQVDQSNVSGLDIAKYLELTEVSLIPYKSANSAELLGYGPTSSGSKLVNFVKFPPDSTLNSQLNTGGPGSRVGNVIGSSSNGTLFSFGGYSYGPTALSPAYFHAFNITSNLWEDRSNQTLNFGIPRLGYNTWTNVNNNYLISIGGGSLLDKDNGVLSSNPMNVAYLFDLNTGEWKTEGLVNCPKETRIGHSSTLLANNQLIVIGGANNNADTLSLIQDSYSIDLSTFSCTKLNIKLETGESTTITKVFHGASLIDNYIIINQGWPYDPMPIILNTQTWAREYKFKSLVLPQFANNINSSSGTLSQKMIIVWSVVGAVVFAVICFCIYFAVRIRKNRRAKQIIRQRERAASGRSSSTTNRRMMTGTSTNNTDTLASGTSRDD
ncbi:hypothetical protein CONCODRAFT_72590 [Conidiobolus coronatus NRRL 28638]|uniref:Galactose oxidase n=1 Tax=Conidiobolus coronatus (strain ATCC 28846 / CBS 209.66 / NRRL 28638) TaxID=796925 RepID=A0A137NYX8_CONC2|nr:hypothetical protein CONCODRAFT_72590 [Conidiobolus coronatus NRRL 28638]|eukprot:KXN67977.1 hypothetical protein CONCODRAFT_72590 [Conidiobolus coronatus NRRL 28638]